MRARHEAYGVDVQEQLMGQVHPDDGFVLTGEERSQFRQIWKELADTDPEPLDAGADDGASRAGWSLAVLACLVLVFVGLAANSVFLVLMASGGALGSQFARRA